MVGIVELTRTTYHTKTEEHLTMTTTGETIKTMSIMIRRMHIKIKELSTTGEITKTMNKMTIVPIQDPKDEENPWCMEDKTFTNTTKGLKRITMTDRRTIIF